MELHSQSGHQLLDLIKNKKTTAKEVWESLESRVRAIDTKVNAYVRKDEKREPSLKPDSQQEGKLMGLAVTIKDNICTTGMNTECCSKILKNFSPPYDATVINKLKTNAASIFNLKANMDEFAFGSSTENSAFMATRNPWDLDSVPGGSSGGSAAAVAADEAIWALGSDTGGSIRQPAAFCGVVGLKPTYGRVSRYGLIAFASSLDQIGPLTKDVEDSAILLEAIAGHDQYDSTSVDIAVPDYKKSLGSGIKSVKIGIPKEYFIEGLDPEIKKIVGEAIDQIKKLGAQVQEVSLAHTEYA
ncbi:MAG: Asp-tRNA(Asn)/Glu-tRNA(Gln) amidotransferase subunit GatA, partial [Candidatus Omnitrophica bacterium]|nr:Asp-tRNA(Asn)/Glu-tRNA(Gln) amidotransferase subunit GatA [Candidatus Omnitrophota bacterium]